MDKALNEDDILELVYCLPDDPATSDVDGDSDDDFLDFGEANKKDSSLESTPTSTPRQVQPVIEDVPLYQANTTPSDVNIVLLETENNPSENLAVLNSTDVEEELPALFDNSFTNLPSTSNAKNEPHSFTFCEHSYSQQVVDSALEKTGIVSNGKEFITESKKGTNKNTKEVTKKKVIKKSAKPVKRKHTMVENNQKSKQLTKEDKKRLKRQKRDEGWNEYDDDISSNLGKVRVTEPKSNRAFSILDQEIEYFSQYFDDELLTLICEQTNLYARQNNTQKWIDVEVDELKAFLGITIVMGIHILPSAVNYWSSDPFLNVPGVSQVMTLNRYKKIVQNLHLNDNLHVPKKGDANFDKLYKLRPLITHMEEKCFDSYVPSGNLVVDEAMVAFKGRSTLKQYQPLKPIKRGYKVWCLADAETGYVVRFEIYTGKCDDTKQNEQFSSFLMCEKVVLNLCEPFFGSEKLVVIDNFFNSFNLAKTLLQNGLYSCGTVRGDRVGLPCVLTDKEPYLNRGDFTFRTKDGVCAIKWRDNKDVCLLSTAHDPKNVVFIDRKEIDGSKIRVSAPEAVRSYNALMGGVDNFDQHRACYQVGRRSRKWWHRLFYFFVELALVNSFNLWKLAKLRGNNMKFRLNLARQLISGFSSRKGRGAKPIAFCHKKPGHVGVPTEVRHTNVGAHIPKESMTRRRCRQCSTKHEEKRTKIICSSCEVPLCTVPCFEIFHRK